MTAVTGLGVILPVHDEESLLGGALAALGEALEHPALTSVARAIVVVLDDCQDRSGEIARRWLRRQSGLVHASAMEVRVANVGVARHAGVRRVLDLWSGSAAEGVWLATTDADSLVPPDWLSRQLHQRDRGAQLWTGSVDVVDWSDRPPGTELAWRADYDAERAPVHGASLAVCADAYLQAGGFAPLRTGEDRALCTDVAALGYTCVHDPSVPVITSARRIARAPAGFSAALTAVKRSAGPMGAAAAG